MAFRFERNYPSRELFEQALRAWFVQAPTEDVVLPGHDQRVVTRVIDRGLRFELKGGTTWAAVGRYLEHVAAMPDAEWTVIENQRGIENKFALGDPPVVVDQFWMYLHRGDVGKVASAHEVGERTPAPSEPHRDTLTKQERLDRIAVLTANSHWNLNEGSSVPSGFISAVLTFCGVPDLTGSIPVRCGRLVEHAGLVWDPVIHDSTFTDSGGGSTVTAAGLARVEEAVRVSLSAPTESAESALEWGAALAQSGVVERPSGERVETPVKRVSSDVRVRDPRVVAWVLLHAKGVCEACGELAPFRRRNGSPYLEVHHVRSVSAGGSDRVENAVAVCPACHRGFHSANDAEARTTKLYAVVSRLEPEPE